MSLFKIIFRKWPAPNGRWAGTISPNRVVVRRRKEGRAQYLKYKEAARALVMERIKYFNDFYNFPFNKVSIKNTKSRWGSCSKKGNLNFNYRIVFLPPALADYLVVHELCHLGEFNHSEKFWNLVAVAVPEYKERRRKLREWPHSKGR